MSPRVRIGSVLLLTLAPGRIDHLVDSIMQSMVLISIIFMVGSGCWIEIEGYSVGQPSAPAAGVRNSLQPAFDAYTETCKDCTCYYPNNCAHFLSNALILGGFNDLHGGKLLYCEYRSPKHGMTVCRNDRPRG